MKGTHLCAVLGAIVLALLFTGGASQAREKYQTRYGYDPAGRVVHVDYRNPSDELLRVNYDYDPAGNILRMRKTRGRDWQVTVKKPSPGAWVLFTWNDGSVRGYGADAARGLFEISGTLVMDGKSATGTLELRSEKTGATFATFVLEKSKVTRDKSGTPTKLTLKSSGSGALKATATPFGAVRAGFAGRFGSAKNQAKIGQEKQPVEEVVFTGDSAHDCACDLGGGVTGRLIRDSKGKAYGTLTVDGSKYVVTSKLKDGTKKVTAKTGKGAPVKVKLTLRREVR